MDSDIKNYPRPQFVRQQWMDLNGSWLFAFDDEKRGLEEHWEKFFPGKGTIQVPFSYETENSGIGDTEFHDTIWYHRTLELKEIEEKKDLYIHFEGCDYQSFLYVNGIYIGTHEGGYNRFSFNISGAVEKGENSITLRVSDSMSTEQLRGKQRWKKENFGCWYVQTTGIWKPVWLEWVPRNHIESCKITPLPEEDSVKIEVRTSSSYPELSLTADVGFNGKTVNLSSQQVKADGFVIFQLDLRNNEVYEWGIKEWSPEHPNLYDLRLTLSAEQEIYDTVCSYFGMRDIRIDGRRVLLNGTPLHQRLLLNQAYWKGSHLTIPSEEAMLEDIDKIVQLGYNGIRLHQKIEDERFLYWCDVKGLLVWCEAPSPYRFSDRMIEDFTSQWAETIRQFYNHPSIIVWVPLNESWGVPTISTVKREQHFSEMIYHLTKSFDPYRPVIANDGWEHTVSDIITLHDYGEDGQSLFKRYTENFDTAFEENFFHNGFKKPFAEGYSYRGQPVIISEYGGIAFENEKNGWGYGYKVANEEEFLKRFEDVTAAIKKMPFVCGYCYTQVTDVQQEINGLLDIDRNFKVDPDKIREINLKKDNW